MFFSPITLLIVDNGKLKKRKCQRKRERASNFRTFIPTFTVCSYDHQVKMRCRDQIQSNHWRRTFQISLGSESESSLLSDFEFSFLLGFVWVSGATVKLCSFYRANYTGIYRSKLILPSIKRLSYDLEPSPSKYVGMEPGDPKASALTYDSATKSSFSFSFFRYFLAYLKEIIIIYSYYKILRINVILCRY